MKRTFHDAHTARKWAERLLVLFIIGVPLIGRDVFLADGSRLWVLWYLVVIGWGIVLRYRRRASTTNGNNT